MLLDMLTVYTLILCTGDCEPAACSLLLPMSPAPEVSFIGLLFQLLLLGFVSIHRCESRVSAL